MVDRRKIIAHTKHEFTDKYGDLYGLSLVDDEMHASRDKLIVASLYVVPEESVWRVYRAWVEPGYRRRGIATALYDYAFRRGFRPLRGGRVQTNDSAALWQHHIREKLIHKGEFVATHHPAQYYWWPTDMPPQRK